jgi:predicted AAA+ superfamily ATPase
MAMFTFDPVQDLYGERRDPDLFLRNHPPPLILDEIQYAAGLVPAVKRWIDANRSPGQFVLTGSHQWQVMRNLSESLAGRTALLELSGFALAETRQDPRLAWFPSWLDAVAKPRGSAAARRMLEAGAPVDWSPAETIWRGSFPEPVGLAQAMVPGWMKGYVATYIQRDVRAVQEIRDEEQFGRFLGLCAALTAQEVNLRQLGREIGASAPTARKWLDALKAGRQWIELPAFARNLTQRISRKPKGYLADTGLACHLLRLPEPASVSGSPAFGALFESLAVAELLKQCAVLGAEPGFYHYRRHSGAEVDLVVEYGGRLFPVEIKASARVRPGDAAGIVKFREAAGAAAGEGLVVYAGDRCLRLGESATAVPLVWQCVEPL